MSAIFEMTDNLLNDFLEEFQSNKKTRSYLLGQLALGIPRDANYSLKDRNELIQSLVTRLEQKALNQEFLANNLNQKERAMNLKKYVVTYRPNDPTETVKQMPIAKEIVAVLRSHDLNYEDAKKALDCANQVLLNHLLNQTKL